MKVLISCAYNIDNCHVELKFLDGSMIATVRVCETFSVNKNIEGLL